MAPEMPARHAGGFFLSVFGRTRSRTNPQRREKAPKAQIIPARPPSLTPPRKKGTRPVNPARARGPLPISYTLDFRWTIKTMVELVFGSVQSLVDSV